MAKQIDQREALHNQQMANVQRLAQQQAALEQQLIARHWDTAKYVSPLCIQIVMSYPDMQDKTQEEVLLKAADLAFDYAEILLAKYGWKFGRKETKVNVDGEAT